VSQELIFLGVYLFIPASFILPLPYRLVTFIRHRSHIILPTDSIIKENTSVPSHSRVSS